MIDRISKFLEDHMELVGVAIFVLIFGMFIGGVVWSVANDNTVWNDGYCTCGGKWEYVDTEKTVHGTDGDIHTTTQYVYKCDGCGKMHKFLELR